MINSVSHPGFALLNEDRWFDNHQAEAQLTDSWKKQGLRPRTKRQDGWFEELGRLVVADANSTRLATPEELKAWFGFGECGDDTCSRELEAFRTVVATMRERDGADCGGGIGHTRTNGRRTGAAQLAWFERCRTRAPSTNGRGVKRLKEIGLDYYANEYIRSLLKFTTMN